MKKILVVLFIALTIFTAAPKQEAKAGLIFAVAGAINNNASLYCAGFVFIVAGALTGNSGYYYLDEDNTSDDANIDTIRGMLLDKFPELDDYATPLAQMANYNLQTAKPSNGTVEAFVSPEMVMSRLSYSDLSAESKTDIANFLKKN